MARDKSDWKNVILENLEKSARTGVTRTSLKINSTVAREALSELLGEGKVVALGTKSRQLLFKKGLEPNRESVRDELIEKLSSGPPRLFTATELGSQLRNSEKAKIAKDLAKSLVKEGELFEFNRKGTSYYVFTAAPGLQIGEQKKPGVDGRKLSRSYGELTKEKGFSAVSISELARRSGVDLEELKNYLVSEAKANRAELSEGDWSVSDEFVRSGAIPFRGKRLLLVELNG